jgi:DNA polymerase-3 subunit delta
MKLNAAQARRFVAAPDKNTRAVLVFGHNQALVREYVEALVRHALGEADDPFALTRLTDEELKKDKARLSDALDAQSLLGGPSVVWLRVENDSLQELIVSTLKARDERPDVGAYWIIEGGELQSKSKIVTAFESAKHGAAIAAYEESDAERHIFLKQALQDARVTMAPDALQWFLMQAPQDRILARGEIEKITLYAHGLNRALEMSDVMALSANEYEDDLDIAAMAALSGRSGAAVEALDRLAGAGGVSAIKTLERRLLRLTEARSLVDHGVAIADAGNRLKPMVFWRERDAFIAQLRRWSMPVLHAALAKCWAAELRCKSAQAPADIIASELFRSVARLVEAT